MGRGRESGADRESEREDERAGRRLGGGERRKKIYTFKLQKHTFAREIQLDLSHPRLPYLPSCTCGAASLPVINAIKTYLPRLIDRQPSLRRNKLSKIQIPSGPNLTLSTWPPLPDLTAISRVIWGHQVQDRGGSHGELWPCRVSVLYSETLPSHHHNFPEPNWRWSCF